MESGELLACHVRHKDVSIVSYVCRTELGSQLQRSRLSARGLCRDVVNVFICQLWFSTHACTHG